MERRWIDVVVVGITLLATIGIGNIISYFEEGKR